MDGILHGFPAPTSQIWSDNLSIPAQATLRSAIDCVGVGLHSGQRVATTLRPAPENHGIVFRRRDLAGGRDIPARFDLVSDTRLATVLAAAGDPALRVSTVEHLLAALEATGVTNALIELDGPELPILDGSAQNFVFLIDCAGVEPQAALRHAVEILRPIRVDQPDGGYAELLPAAPDAPFGLSASMSIAFDAPAIGTQTITLQISPQTIRSDLAGARTFTLLADIAALQAAGLAQGGSLENAVVVDGARVLNSGGLRVEREFVRHKLLDAVGDLALAGVALHGRLNAHRTGHAANNRLLRSLFADAANWRPLTPGAAAAPPPPPSAAQPGRTPARAQIYA